MNLFISSHLFAYKLMHIIIFLPFSISVANICFIFIRNDVVCLVEKFESHKLNFKVSRLTQIHLSRHKWIKKIYLFLYLSAIVWTQKLSMFVRIVYQNVDSKNFHWNVVVSRLFMISKVLFLSVSLRCINCLLK